MGSVRRRSGQVRVALSMDETAFLVSQLSEVSALLSVGGSPPNPPPGDSLEALVGLTTAPVDTPHDPALLRLLPDAYRDDDDAAQEFRRLTDAGLRSSKRDRLDRVLADLRAPEVRQPDGGVRLSLAAETVEIWLPALTDLRLTLGTRIGVTADIDDERDRVVPGTRRYAEIAAYDWLSWLQEAMVRAIAGD